MTDINNSIPQTKESQANLSPEDALKMLMDGNQRFLDNAPFDRNTAQHVEVGRGGQWPFAAILSCIDSRVPVETVFDQGIGDVFSARVAGNIANDDLLGSLEYATAVAGSKLIMVLGHTSCGAVKSACQRVEVGNVTALLSRILPAVGEVEKEMANDPDNPDFTNKVTEVNVKLTIQNMLNRSDIIRGLSEKDASDKSRIMIVGAVYDVMTGAVKILE